MLSTAERLHPGNTDESMSIVTVIDEWPSLSCTTLGWTPARSKTVA